MPAYEFTTTADGQPAFRKYATGGPDARFAAEAEGLAALATTATVRTPRVLAVNEQELVTERIAPGQPDTLSWQQLGHALAAMHRINQPCFGFTGDNFCGDTPQPNPRTDDGYQFFALHRLEYQGRLARDAELLDGEDINGLERLGGRLPELVPRQAPALLHGDLWNGNVLFDGEGQAVIIDPACYWGWPEAEIAMCALFGGFPEAFYQAWSERFDAEPGWQERLPIYQLYHLLNHLNLFGGNYRSQVMTIIKRFS